MTEQPQIVRRCKDCPDWTHTVCRFTFGVYWCVKSGDGEGCKYPLDDVAEKWRKGGWTPDKSETVPITVSVKDLEKPKPKPSKKVSQVQLDLVLTAEPAPLTDDDY